MLTRKQAVQQIVSSLKNQAIISSNGMISRTLYKVCDRELNFYMLGSMGCTLAIGLGLAYARPDIEVIVISGDGSALMGLSTFALHNKLKLKNLRHYILDNNAHATTGGQETCSDAVDFEKLAPNTYVIKISNEKGDAPRVPLHPKEIRKRFENAVNNIKKK